MNLLTVLLVLVVAGVVLWLINLAPFIDARMKKIAFWVVIVFIVLWLLKLSGLLGSLGQVNV